MAEIEEALRAEVSKVCQNYCPQVWNEALNQAGVKASSILRRAKSVYYPLAIRASSLANSKTNTALKVAELGKASPAKALTSSDNLSEVVKQSGVVEKEVNTTRGVAPDATKPPTASQDLPVKKKVPTRMEIVLATLLVPTKGDLASKGPKALEAAST